MIGEIIFGSLLGMIFGFGCWISAKAVRGLISKSAKSQQGSSRQFIVKLYISGCAVVVVGWAIYLFLFTKARFYGELSGDFTSEFLRLFLSTGTGYILGFWLFYVLHGKRDRRA